MMQNQAPSPSGTTTWYWDGPLTLDTVISIAPGREVRLTQLLALTNASPSLLDWWEAHSGGYQPTPDAPPSPSVASPGP